MAYAEGCTLYDTIDEVYLNDADCDGWPDDVPMAEEQVMPSVMDNSVYSQEETIIPIAAEIPSGNGLAIDYIGQRTILAGKADYYALKIANLEDQPVVIDIQIDSIKDWGTYRLEPGSRITLQPGQEEDLFVFVTADFNAAPGEYQVIVHLKTDSVEEVLKLNTSVVSDGAIELNKKQLETILIILAILILVIGLILGFDRLRKSKKEEKHSYY